MKFLRLAALGALFSMPLAGFAQQPATSNSTGSGADGGPPPGAAPHGPPPEAIAACQGKAVGVTASFTDRRGRTISGACTQMGDVVAVPPPAHRGGQGGMPPAGGQ